MKKLWLSESSFINLSEKESFSLTDEIASRKRSIDFYSLGMYLPNPDHVLKKQGKDITIYSELLTDAHLGGCVSSRKAGVTSLEWGIDRGKAPSRQAKLVEDLFNTLDIQSIAKQILNAVLFGYQPLEIMWENRGGYILPKDVVAKPPEWFTFGMENELRFRSRDNYLYGEALPDRKFLLPRNNATYQNPYGFPELSRCFWPLTFKKGGMKFWVTFTEKYGMPFIIGKKPRGTDKSETDALADVLEQMVQDAVAVIPDDASVEIMSPKGTASSDIYEKLLEFCKTEVAIAILGQNLTTEVKGGSYAAAQSHMAVRQDIVDGDRRIVEQVFNELIGWVYEINFGTSGVLPVFSMWQEEDVDLDQATRDKTLSDTGVKFTKAYFMKAYGFEEEDIEVGAPPSEFSGAQLPGVALKQFAEAYAASGYPDQAALDAAAASLSPKELQRQAEGVLRPIIELIEQGHDYQEILSNLAATFPELSDKAVVDMLGRAIFVSELWGRLSAKKEG